MNAVADHLLQFRALLAGIEEFCRRTAQRVRAGRVSLEHLSEALVFHATRGTLAVVWQTPNSNLPTPKIAGVAIAWQTHTATVLEAEQQNKSVFNWQPSDPTGDCVYLALVATETPSAMRPLAQYFLNRFPAWHTLPMYAHRRGKLRRETGLLQRLAKLPTPNFQLQQ